jgi:serine protease Do
MRPLQFRVQPAALAFALAAALGLAGFAQAAPTAEDAACMERAPQPAMPAGQSFAAAVARNSQAVVSVTVIRARRDPFEEFEGIEFFLSSVSGTPTQGGAPLPGDPTPERSGSSGFVIDAGGYILTSAHSVVDAHEIWVRIADNMRLQARVVGLDRRADVALLKVEAAGLPVASMALGTRLCAGEWVFAIGSPFGFEHSVTAGIVSANPRYLPGGGGLPLIQTDTAINPGSSGGPLFNAAGVVVGMNSMIYSGLGGYQGISFALPIDRVMRIAQALRQSGGAARADIGIRTQPVTAELAGVFGLDRVEGALIVRVEAASPAATAGLRPGDVVLSVNRARATAQPEIEEAIASARTGAPMLLGVWRRKSPVRVVVAPPETPPLERNEPAPRLADESRLGITPAHVSAGLPPGLYVEAAGGAALLAGVEPGDRITAVNDMEIASLADFDAALASASADGMVALLVTRGSVALYLPVRQRGSTNLSSSAPRGSAAPRSFSRTPASASDASP